MTKTRKIAKIDLTQIRNPITIEFAKDTTVDYIWDITPDEAKHRKSERKFVKDERIKCRQIDLGDGDAVVYIDGGGMHDDRFHTDRLNVRIF